MFRYELGARVGVRLGRSTITGTVGAQLARPGTTMYEVRWFDTENRLQSAWFDEADVFAD